MRFDFGAVEVTPEDKAGEFRYYTDGAARGVKMLRSLPEEDLREIAGGGELAAAFGRELGPKTNPNWVIGGAAAELYRRGLIDEHELYRLTN